MGRARSSSWHERSAQECEIHSLTCGGSFRVTCFGAQRKVKNGEWTDVDRNLWVTTRRLLGSQWMGKQSDYDSGPKHGTHRYIGNHLDRKSNPHAQITPWSGVDLNRDSSQIGWKASQTFSRMSIIPMIKTLQDGTSVYQWWNSSIIFIAEKSRKWRTIRNFWTEQQDLDTKRIEKWQWILLRQPAELTRDVESKKIYPPT